MHGLLFDSAKAEHTDAVYEPVALLGEQQDVYCILCRAMVDDEDAEPYYTLVYVGKNGVQVTVQSRRERCKKWLPKIQKEI